MYQTKQLSSDDFLDYMNRLDSVFPVTLFLGAGVSSGLIPTWNDLIHELLESSIETILGFSNCKYTNKAALLNWFMRKLSVYDQAMLIKATLKHRYISLLHSVLYREVTYDKIFNDDTLGAVAKLSTNKRIKSIITYNWDNLLELRLESLRDANYLQRCVTPIFADYTELVNIDKLPVYHVHGYLPYITPYQLTNLNEIVLSMDEYVRFNINVTSWQTTIQLNSLQSSMCLFIGTSLSDMNMLRLLHTARAQCHNKQIYYIGCEESILGKKSSNIDPKAKLTIYTNYLREVGVNVIIVDSYNDVNRLLQDISHHMKEE